MNFSFYLYALHNGPRQGFDVSFQTWVDAQEPDDHEPREWSSSEYVLHGVRGTYEDLQFLAAHWQNSRRILEDNTWTGLELTLLGRGLKMFRPAEASMPEAHRHFAGFFGFRPDLPIGGYVYSSALNLTWLRALRLVYRGDISPEADRWRAGLIPVAKDALDDHTSQEGYRWQAGCPSAARDALDDPQLDSEAPASTLVYNEPEPHVHSSNWITTSSPAAGVCEVCGQTAWDLHPARPWQVHPGRHCTDCMNTDRIIKSYDYRPEEFHPEGEPPYLGVELEVALDSEDCQDVARRAYRYGHYVVHDGTIEPGGFEICSQPKALDRHSWADLLFELEEAGCWAGDTCGLHIHISRQLLSSTEQLKLAFFVYSQAYQMARLGGRTFSECQRYAKFKAPSRLLDSMRNTSKYEAVNVLHVPTIELRFFKATLHNLQLLRCLQLADSLHAFVKQVSIAKLIDTPVAWKQFKLFVAKRKSAAHLASRLGECDDI